MKNRLILSVFLMLIPAFISAQELTLGIEEAIALAKEHNRSIQSVELEISMLQRQQETSWNTWLPNIGITGNTEMDDGLFISSTGDPGFTFAGVLSASLPISFTSRLEQQSRELELDQKFIGLDAQQEGIELMTAQIYRSLQVESQAIELAVRNLEIAQDELASAQVSYDAGRTSRLEVLQREQTVSHLEFELESMKSEQRTRIASFLRMLGMKVGNYTLVLPDKVEADYSHYLSSEDQEALVRNVLSRDVQLQTMDRELQRQELEKEITRRNAYFPSISISGNYRTVYADISNPFLPPTAGGYDWSDSYSFSLSATIPITSYIRGSAASVGMEQYSSGIRQLELQYEQQREDVMEEFRSLSEELRLASMQVDQADRRVELAREVYEATWESYEAGMTSYREVQRSLYDLQQAEYGVLGAQLGYEMSYMKLQQQLGIDIIGMFAR